ncbi:MAG: 2-amino-4-hydroxy-6-hydroxymethyldihydropteridine diphosphokinase [Synergistaceae bacterium]
MNKRNVVLALGSNLGDRLTNLKTALKEIELSGFSVTAKSSVWETEPWGDADQDSFFNMCITALYDLDESTMLKQLKNIEKRMGREKTRHWGPRIIDIDIILVDDVVYKSDLLEIPHPLMHLRSFVLKPLAEIAPNIIHPLLNKSIITLLSEIKEEKMERVATL